MFIADDATYYADREAAARRLAHAASDPAARFAHLKMAAEYRRMAAEARKKITISQQPGLKPGDERAPERTSLSTSRAAPAWRHQRWGAPTHLLQGAGRAPADSKS